jgi:hypothetical protein
VQNSTCSHAKAKVNVVISDGLMTECFEGLISTARRVLVVSFIHSDLQFTASCKPYNYCSKRDCIIEHNFSEVDSVLRSETAQDWPRESILMAEIRHDNESDITRTQLSICMNFFRYNDKNSRQNCP